MGCFILAGLSAGDDDDPVVKKQRQKAVEAWGPLCCDELKNHQTGPDPCDGRFFTSREFPIRFLLRQQSPADLLEEQLSEFLFFCASPQGLDLF